MEHCHSHCKNEPQTVEVVTDDYDECGNFEFCSRDEASTFVLKLINRSIELRREHGERACRCFLEICWYPGRPHKRGWFRGQPKDALKFFCGPDTRGSVGMPL